ncbi:MAG TPA: alpha/beta fold hydrolase, partial [Actinomycetaceae bacterium]|nr:alpha/beta fold hydrolase [Actinomycetaceae bacterium]
MIVPPDLPGLRPHWSRTITVAAAQGNPPATWHVLDNNADLTQPARGTILAVHGNPTWSYLWRGLLEAAAPLGWRVVAVDQLGMGYSARDGRARRLADRVEELEQLTDAL